MANNKIHANNNGKSVAQNETKNSNLLQVDNDLSASGGSSCTLSKSERLNLELFVNEHTFTERVRYYFIKNQTTSLRIRLFKFVLKITTVILYLIGSAQDEASTTTCCGRCIQEAAGPDGVNPTWINQYDFSWLPIIWTERPEPIWITQVALAIISLFHEIINTFVNYKGNLAQQLISINWFIEIICTVPFLVTIFHESLQCLFVPVFLNIWLAKSGLESIINDLHRVAHKQQSAMFNQVVILLATLICLFITCICGVQHLERGGKDRIDLFDSMWFVVVTFSTVGYGDITPTIWPSRLLVIVIIFVALGIIPSQLEQLSFLWGERQKQGGEYSRQRAKTEKHVVVCSTVLRMDVTLDFLNEFYAHPVLQNYYVVLLSPCEMDGTLKRFLQVPIWAERVIYIQGSLLRDEDLIRVKMDAAEACFILTSRREVDRAAADEKTILRAMSVKDFTPKCPLFVQILRPESKLHVQFADCVICDDEFKYVLLAMNSFIPGISTLITLLAHTSKGQEGRNLKSDWKREFGRSAGNEIYSVVAQNSKFFGDYVGQKFNHASMLAQSKCGATLFGVERYGEMKINPGPQFVIDAEDTLFYICLTQEEDAKIVKNESAGSIKKANGDKSTELIKYSPVGQQILESTPAKEQLGRKIGNVLEKKGKSESTTMGRTEIGFPPVSPYVGHITPTMCHILIERAKPCCVRLDRPCEHCRNTSASHYNWTHAPIVVIAEFASQSLFNAMVPLRAHHNQRRSLRPIILLLEHSPENSFVNAINCFPMVYYMLGSMSGLDSLLHAGVANAHTVIIVDRETSMYAEEEYMADSRQLVATQTMYRLFPQVTTCLELTYAPNMRFMHFTAPDPYTDAEEFRKEREKEKSCSPPYLFREPFASGKVFSPSMLDTLLYQSFIKGYLTTLLRIMLGLQYSAGSGYLATHKVEENEAGGTYSHQFRLMSKRSGCILLGIYRYKSVISMSNKSDFLKINMETTEMGDFQSSTEKLTESDEADEFTTEKKRRQSAISLASLKQSFKSKFRTSKRQSLRKLHLLHSTKSERENLDDAIEARMLELNIPLKPSYNTSNEETNVDRFGYILLNPTGDTKLQCGDILYLINPEIVHETNSASSRTSSKQNSISEDELMRDVTSSNVATDALRRISSITEEALDVEEEDVIKSPGEFSAGPKFSRQLKREEEITEA